MRLLFKPETQTLWGFNSMLIKQSRLLGSKAEDDHPEDIDEENDVDMNRTMWLVMRKTKPTNETLKKFYAET